MTWFRRLFVRAQLRHQIEQAQNRAALHQPHGKDDVDALFESCVDEHQRGRRRDPLKRFSTSDLIAEVMNRYDAVLFATLEDDGDGQLFDYSYTGGHTQALGMATRTAESILNADRKRQT